MKPSAALFTTFIQHVERFVVNGKQEPEHDVSPVDTNWNSLFDTAYTHPKLRTSRWQWVFYDWWTKGAWLLLNNTRYGYGQHAGVKKGYHMSQGEWRSCFIAQPRD